MFQQYLRTGDRRFFARGEQAARHHIDVDTVHATNPHLKNPFGAPPRVGEIWLHSVGHTGGYYTNAPLPVETAYQMGHSANFGHVWISGDLAYEAQLTGNREHQRILREGFHAAIAHGGGNSFGKGLGQMTFFAPFALKALAEQQP